LLPSLQVSPIKVIVGRPAYGLSRSVHVIFQVYLEGEAALTAAGEAAATSQEKWPPVRAEWMQSCRNMHPDWEFKLWNLTAMEALIQDVYPWFLPTFQAYPADIHKGNYSQVSFKERGTNFSMQTNVPPKPCQNLVEMC